MGDLFLHVAFARRLRTAEGVHPLVAETIVRRAPLVAYGAALPLLPEQERRGLGFFQRLFGIGAGDATKWATALKPGTGALPKLALSVLDLEAAPPKGEPSTGEIHGGPMSRLALAIGLLSHEILDEEIAPILESVDPAQRAGIERGQARLWLQAAVPNKRELHLEWSSFAGANESDVLRRAIEGFDHACERGISQRPGREHLTRWTKTLSRAVAPLVDGSGLPDSTGPADHDVKAQYFDGNTYFVDKTQAATTRLVYLLGSVAQLFVSKTPSRAEIDAVLFENGALKKSPESGDLTAIATTWKTSVGEIREDLLTRGRNAKSAFAEDVPDLPPLPPDDDDEEAPSTLPVRSSDSSAGQKADGASDATSSKSDATSSKSAENAGFAAPAHTQQVSVDDIESELAEKSASSSDAATEDTADVGDKKADATPANAESAQAAAAVKSGSAPPAAPATTQQISVADIEAEFSATKSTKDTQPVSLDDIHSEEKQSADVKDAFASPTSTQQISLSDIEAEMSVDDDPPLPPAVTQQISAADIEAELHTDDPPPAAPAVTQQISLADIEAEMSSSDVEEKPNPTAQKPTSD